MTRVLLGDSRCFTSRTSNTESRQVTLLRRPSAFPRCYFWLADANMCHTVFRLFIMTLLSLQMRLFYPALIFCQTHFWTPQSGITSPPVDGLQYCRILGPFSSSSDRLNWLWAAVWMDATTQLKWTDPSVEVITCSFKRENGEWQWQCQRSTTGDPARS